MNMQYSSKQQLREQLVRTSGQAPLTLTPTSQSIMTSPTLAIHEAVASRRAAGHDTLHLGFGEASFPLHPLLKTALAEAAPHTGYAPVAGIPALRQAIAAYLTSKRQIPFTSDQIIVGPGSKALLFTLLQVLDGDILLPLPSWVSYAPMAHLAGKRVIGVQADPHDHHRLNPDRLSQAVSQARQEGAHPRILLVNSPHNPTGSMFDHATLEALACWARDNGITLISDEIYAELAHGWREHISPARFYPEGTIITGGLSKAFAAGGWRLGFAALPSTEAGARAMVALCALASEIWSAASTPVQEAATVAFSQHEAIESSVQRSAHVYGYVTDQLYQTLRQLDVLCPRPAGGFYLYPDFSPWRSVLRSRGVETSQDLAHYLLAEWDTATLPGTAFQEEPTALRLRLATSALCEPRPAVSDEEREAALFHLLDQEETLFERRPAFPLLERAQTFWTAFIRDL
ncbi:MAG: aminotransferase class I/II-fold pyridoxal phosphate-dependent enzyme [Ktedonobacteraceae bacterium]|nr:aminotransferase class I/II-fold pyridoxal phosphate-dependent enzyme [Ktedonobacteraceae bacterium]